MDENKGESLMHDDYFEQLKCYWKQLFKHTQTELKGSNLRSHRHSHKV